MLGIARSLDSRAGGQHTVIQATLGEHGVGSGEDGVWAYTEPDWEKLMAVVSGNGPASAERIAFRKLSRAEIDWVSRTVLAEAA